MNRTTAYVTLGLSGIGLMGCAAGLIGLWMARSYVMNSSENLLDATDDGLALVETKAALVVDLLDKLRAGVESSRIVQLADKANRTPEDEQKLQRISEGLTERLQQVDAIADTAESAVTALNKSARLARSLQLRGSRNNPGASPAAGSKELSEALSKTAENLKNLRESLATILDKDRAQDGLVAVVVRTARTVDENMRSVGDQVRQVHQQAADWGEDVAALRNTLPVWTNGIAIFGTLFLAWMGVGQYGLLRRAWDVIRPSKQA